ncbi:hypothetical protein BYT27DRAFT_7030991, partial [Phlegmacium glaucopus]
WQVKLAEKVLGGHNAIGLVGTGAGKSLVFTMLAIATELAGFSGIMIVICPLKSLQKDQVSYQNQDLKLTAIAINEDNNEGKVFTDLSRGKYRICYASPEILL